MKGSVLAPAPPRGGSGLASWGVSIALHATFFAALLAARPLSERRAEPVSIEIVETRPAPPLPEEPSRAPSPLPAPPRRSPTHPAPTRQAPRALSPAPRPQSEEEPPPPGPPAPTPAVAAPTAAPGPSRTQARFGVSMSSTTAAGGIAAPVGDALSGRAPEGAEGPLSALPGSVGHYAPPTAVSSLPEPLGCDIPKSEYPEEARRLGIEGEVLLHLVVDDEGRVAEATVVRDPGHGLGARSIESAKRHCRFRAATKDGRPVATEIPFRLTWVLE